VPTYQYSCTECGHFFEAYQGFSDDALSECPECGGRLRKVFNAVGVVFKGSGFYRTDSRGKSTADAGSSASSSSSDSAGSNGASSNGTGSTGASTPSTTSAPAAASS
jgi:putative FmdB family regulatory protein